LAIGGLNPQARAYRSSITEVGRPLKSDANMSPFSDNSRRGTIPGGPSGVYLLVFLVTAGAVYAWGWKPMQPPRLGLPQPRALVVVQWPLQAAGTERAWPFSPPDQAILKREILSDAYLRWALENSDTTPSSHLDGNRLTAMIEAVRQGLRVEATAESSRGEVRISIAGRDQGPPVAAAVVNNLAAHYADQCRDGLKSAARQAYAAAQRACDRAAQQTQQARAKLDEFLVGHFRDHPSRDMPEPAAAPPRQPAAPAGPEQYVVFNPQWVRLSEDLAALRGRRADRLTVWTPEHPEIQDLDARIAQAESQLATMPREIAANRSDLPVIVRGSAGLSQPSTASPADARPTTAAAAISAQQLAEAAGTYRTLSGELNQAIQGEQQLAQAERRAWQQQFLVPRVETVASPSVAPVGPVPWIASLVTALCAGLAATAGVALTVRIVQGRRTLDTAEEVQNVLSIRVLGSMPADAAYDTARCGEPVGSVAA
jgi:hypothetical protein